MAHRKSRQGDKRALRTTVPSILRVPSHLARRFNQLCVGIIAEVTEPEGLIPTQYALLVALDEQPGIDQRTLALRLGTDAVTTGQLIGELEEAGFVDRKVDVADRRARILGLTREGTHLRRRLRPLVIAADARVMGSLEPKEQSQFLNFLTRIVEANESYARPGNGRRRRARKRSLKKVNVLTKP